MSESRNTSIYLPKELKQQLVETAEAEGFEVGYGRKSCLAKFIGEVLREHKRSQNVLSYLSPELRSSVTMLSEMSTAQQKLVSAILEPLLANWQETEKA